MPIFAGVQLGLVKSANFQIHLYLLIFLRTLEQVFSHWATY